MFRKRFALVIILTMIISILFSCSSDSKSLRLIPSNLFFGGVNLGDTVSHDVIIKNKFDELTTITEIKFNNTTDFSISSGGTVPINLDVDEEHKITIAFKPSKLGEISGELLLTHINSTTPKKYSLRGVGITVPRLDISELSHDFSYRLTNSITDHNFIIENEGTADLTLYSINLTGSGASEYSITLGSSTPVVLTPGSTHTITVQFAPTSVGQFTCELVIKHDAIDEPSPLIVSMDGEAFTSAPIIKVNQTSPIDFGSVSKTIPLMKTIEIASNGLSPLTITSIDLATGTEFTLDHVEDNGGNTVNLPQTVNVGDKITAFIKFAPISNANYYDTLSIVHDAIFTSSPIDISLIGVGRDEISKIFGFTGSPQQWVVPDEVSTIIVECYGAEGWGCDGGIKGLGGMSKATVSVTPGSTVNIYVGGRSFDYQGGWNGGGDCSDLYNGAGGGGGSDIRIGGDTLADRKIVGGGGGGAGFDSGSGGHGGDLTGDDGIGGYNNYPGKGGTQTAGGTASWSACTDGALGQGGKGVGSSAGGGGGGGGYYGGAGGFCSGGGGGSSYYDAPGNSDKSTQKGVRSGDGEIIIRY